MRKLLPWVLLPVLVALAAHFHRQGSLVLPEQLQGPAADLWQQLRVHLPLTVPASQLRDTSAQHDSFTKPTPTKEAEIIRVVSNSADAGQCHIPGKVDDLSDCTFSAVHGLNHLHVNPVVRELVKTAFFRFFKVNIYCVCPLWPDDSMCHNRACSVCECGENEVPVPWLAAEQKAAQSCKAVESPDCDTEGCTLEMESAVNQSLDPAVEQQLIKHSKGWRGINNPWMADGDDSEEFQYINLVVNPERYTGYKGDHAHRIWDAIYNQSCFADGVSCDEERVFYRLISGMHASISCHLASDYLLDEQQGIWGPNMTEFQQRLGTPETRDRVKNLYFAYLFVLRAVMKAAPVLTTYQYDTGLREEDDRTQQLITQLLSNPAISVSCPMPFDEGRLWKGDHGAELKRQLQATFQNITRVMDCVGCEKCKLWGKLQTLGIATALKILFSSRDCSGEMPDTSQLPFGEDLVLERNEVIALVNLLGRFSHSLETYHRLTTELQQQQGVTPSIAEKAAVV